MAQTTDNHPRHQAAYDVIIIGAGIVSALGEGVDEFKVGDRL